MKDDSEESMRDEYDFSQGVRGKYASQFAQASNVVLLEPDVAAEFPNSDAVNEALRDVIRRRTSARDD